MNNSDIFQDDISCIVNIRGKKEQKNIKKKLLDEDVIELDKSEEKKRESDAIEIEFDIMTSYSEKNF